jgi:hypothetical protein
MSEVYEREERRAKKLAVVRGLLAKADSTTHEGEAQVFRDRADVLMAKYAIEEFEVQQDDDLDHRRPEPESRPVDITWYWQHSQATSLLSLMMDVARHCRCVIVIWVPAERTSGGMNMRTGQRTPDKLELPVVGMPSDLDYFDMLFTHLMLQLEKGLEPKPDPDKSMEENLAIMKEAGMKWQRIADLLAQAGQLPQHEVGGPVHRLGLSSIYTRFCDRTGRKRLRVSPGVYQRSWSEGFVMAVNEKFRRQRRFREEKPTDAKYAPGMDKGMQLALRDITEVVRAKAEELYPKEPASGKARRSRGRIDKRKRDYGAQSQGMAAGARADISGAKGREGVEGGRKGLPSGS